MKLVEDLAHSSYGQNSGFGFPTQSESMDVKLDLTIPAVVFILLTVPFGCARLDAHSVPLQVCVLGNSSIIHYFTLTQYLFCEIFL